MAEAEKRILIVDDEADIIELLTVMLKGQGYSVLTAVDGQEALEKARKEKPDLIILDIMLPKIDGFKVARMLKFDESYSSIPIIMLTAKIREKDREMGMETGADFYMTKPFESGMILLKVKELLAKQGVEEQG
ncbi:MAG: response regulator [Candidatus Margulisbacteria bacterium]|nr:response regulator [Candidatus Margulisiibacteriota bacterium]